MKDTDRIIDQLHELPPDLTDPVDRFEQIRERARRTRRRQTVVGGVAGAAVLALAVPFATQLLPETAEVGPAGGVTQTSSPPPADEARPTSYPGGVESTPLSEPLTVRGSGTGTAELGDRPSGASAVTVIFNCLDAGTFRVSDTAALECDHGGPAPELKGDGIVFLADLAAGQESIKVDATDGAAWSMITTYVSTEVTEWGVNAKGETFGVQNDKGEPDLIPVSATNGREGYARVAEMNAAYGPEPTSPEHAVEMQEERAGQTVSVQVYESDGETVVGEFVIGGASGGDVSSATSTVHFGDVSTATSTMAP